MKRLLYALTALSLLIGVARSDEAMNAERSRFEELARIDDELCRCYEEGGVAALEDHVTPALLRRHDAFIVARHLLVRHAEAVLADPPVESRALEVAAAGGHNLLMIGPPGSGNSMLAARLPSILPPLTPEEMLAIA